MIIWFSFPSCPRSTRASRELKFKATPPATTLNLGSQTFSKEMSHQMRPSIPLKTTKNSSADSLQQNLFNYRGWCDQAWQHWPWQLRIQKSHSKFSEAIIAVQTFNHWHLPLNKQSRGVNIQTMHSFPTKDTNPNQHPLHVWLQHAG